MLERLGVDIKAAMKNKQKDKLEALRYLKSMLLENKTAKKPIAEVDVAINLAKKLNDSLSSYPEDSPAREKILKELSFLDDYLPQKMDEAKVRDLIENIIAKSDSPQLGLVMKELNSHIKGRFDGKRASEMVKDLLG